MARILLDGKEISEEELMEETKKATAAKKRVVLAECIMDEAGLDTQEKKYVTKFILHD